MMVISLLLVHNFSIGVSASTNCDRQEADTCITTSRRLSVKGGSPSGKVWDYSKQFNGELSNFNDGYNIYNIYSVVDKNMYLVQFHSGAEVGSGRSLKYWTTIEEANGISIIDEYMDNMALLSDWGARDNVSIARIPAGTKIM